MNFSGALLGTDTFHPGQALPLLGLDSIFCIMEQNEVFFTDSPTEGPLFTIYYDETSGCYGLIPENNQSVFLKSGQPLGKHKTYVLFPGTTLYLYERNNAFILA